MYNRSIQGLDAYALQNWVTGIFCIRNCRTRLKNRVLVGDLDPKCDAWVYFNFNRAGLGYIVL